MAASPVEVSSAQMLKGLIKLILWILRTIILLWYYSMVSQVQFTNIALETLKSLNDKNINNNEDEEITPDTMRKKQIQTPAQEVSL